MLVQITGWRQYIREGEQYLKCAVNAAEKRSGVFTPVILYNLIGMAIEKFLMGFLMHHGALAENHTMIDILRSVEKITGPQPQMAKDFRYLDSFQEICDMDAFNRREPDLTEIPRILACGVKIQAIPGLVLMGSL
jgi:hypothetical protein